jgi:hypothetical protein
MNGIQKIFYRRNGGINGPLGTQIVCPWGSNARFASSLWDLQARPVLPDAGPGGGLVLLSARVRSAIHGPGDQRQ